MIFEGNKIYEENPNVADDYRQKYLNGINDFINAQNELSKKVRDSYFDITFLKENPEKYRNKFKEMIGIDALPKCEKSAECKKIGSDDICDLYRLVVYPVKEIPFYCLLMVPHGITDAPLFIAQHGGGGTPELCCDIYGTNNYNHLAQRALKRGAVILAPQLLLWATEETKTMRAHNIKHNRQEIDASLKRFGASITALEIIGIIKSIDYATTLAFVNSDKIVMAGLSYGGYFTLHTMAVDTRIKAGYTAAAFNDRNVYDWPDWCYKNSSNKFHDAEIAAICAPRKLYISVGKDDQTFNYQTAISEVERAKSYFKSLGIENNIRFNLWDGAHTIPDNDEAYEFLFSAI